MDEASMAGEHRELGSRVCIPDPGGLVIRGGDDAGAVGRVGGGIDEASTAREHRELGPSACIPDPRGLVIGRGDDAGAVGRVGGGVNTIAVAGEHRELRLPCGHPRSGRSCRPTR